MSATVVQVELLAEICQRYENSPSPSGSEESLVAVRVLPTIGSPPITNRASPRSVAAGFRKAAQGSLPPTMDAEAIPTVSTWMVPAKTARWLPLPRIAPVKSALERSAPVRSAPVRSAPAKLTSRNLAPRRLAPRRITPEKSALPKSAPLRFASLRSVAVKVASEK